ncbi:Transmembrane protein 41A [Blattella germanica]|nr:Transmembrane protein 41A [Blattella germanica]
MEGHIYYLIPIVAIATLWLYFLTQIAPSLDADTAPDLQFPTNLTELQKLAGVLRLYKSKNLLYTLVLFCSAYLYKQAFIIPGSVFLNILAGALFGIHIGFPLACVLTSIGSSLCYMWSLWLGKDLLEHYFSERVHKLQAQVARNQHQLLYYLLFLRMFPISPNWLINLTCPILGVPLRTFFFSIFIGLMPYNFMTVQAGEILGSLTSLDEFVKVKTLLKLGAMAFSALIPPLIFRKHADITIRSSCEPKVDRPT